MYERMVQALSKDKPAICIVFEHNEDFDKPIKAAECNIREYYARDKDENFNWVKMTHEIKLKDYIPVLIKHMNILKGRNAEFGNFIKEIN